MKKYSKIQLLLGITAISLTMYQKLYAQDYVNFAYVPVNITSCVPALGGAVEAVTYTVTFPLPTTACIGAADVSIFFTDLETPVAQIATSAFSVIATNSSYSDVVYVAPVEPCATPGAMCATTVVFVCYEPSVSTVYIGGSGSTCS